MLPHTWELLVRTSMAWSCTAQDLPERTMHLLLRRCSRDMKMAKQTSADYVLDKGSFGSFQMLLLTRQNYC